MLRKLLAPSSTRLLALLIVVSASAAFAQTETAARITQPIDDSARVTLKGNVPLIARAQNDRGQAPVSTPYTGMRLVLQRSPRQEAALQQYLSELQDKSSPNYHKWLTPEQFGKLYGPADADIQKLTAWLEGHGFQVTSVPTGRTTIAFSGTIGQAQEAFSVEIHSFQTKTEQFFSNTTDPQIPVALSGVVSGIAGLNTIKPRPMNHHGPTGHFDASSKKFAPAPGSTSFPHRNFTENDGGGFYSLWTVAADAATIYNTPNSFNAAFSSGNSYTGKNATIGIIGDSAISTSYVQNYRKLFVGDSVAPTVTNVDGVAENGDSGEAYLDNEIAGALAPGATIHFYTANHLETAIETALTANKVDILNVSFGLCEALLTTENSTFNNYWAQAAGQGISVTVSTGDNGSAGCDDQNSEVNADFGLFVNGVASTPYNIAVGGTDFAALVTSDSAFTNYVSTTNSTPYYRSAKSYIPESTWNDSTANNTTISQNVPWDQTSANIADNIVAASGGASNCSTNTVDAQNNINCTNGYAKPVWQKGTGVPNDQARDLPDVSLLAGNGIDAALWLVCDDGTDSNNDVLGCVKQSDGTFFYDGFGGTSAASPAFAGMLALVVQKYGRQGQAAPVLYDLFNGSHGSSIFYDTTEGNNSVECDAGTPDCALNDAGFYYESGWDTNKGYDLATGLGSVNVTNLVNFWSTAVGSATATVTVTPASQTITRAQSLKVSISVAGSGSNGAPTGTVTLSGGGYTSSATKLTTSTNSGVATITIPANSLSEGAVTLTAKYSGDPIYGTASGTADIAVNIPGSIALSANPSSLTLTAGATSGNTSTITVTPSGGYTGNLNLSCSVSGGPSGAVKPTCAFNKSSIPISGAASVAAVLTVTTDAASSELQWPGHPGRWYSAAGGAALACILLFGIPARRRAWKNMLGVVCAFVALSFTGIAIGCGGGGGGGGGTTKTTPTVTVTPNKTTINVSDSLSVGVSVTGGSSTPTGSVTLSSGSYTSAATTLASGAASITIPANKLTAGTDTLSASYSGDSSYNAATGTASVTVNKPGTTAGTYTIKITATDSNVSTFTASTNVSVTVN